MSSTRSRKSSGQSALPSPDGVPIENFMLRVMAERMATGKRQIRPKQVSDVFVAEESDDPDFEMNSSGSAKSGSDNSDSDSKGGSDSNDSSKGSSDESDSDDGSPDQGKSSLRAAVQKMKEMSPEFSMPRKKRAKRKPKATTAAGTEGNKVVAKRKPKKKITVSSKNKMSKAKAAASLNGNKKNKLKVKRNRRSSKYDSIQLLVNDIGANMLDTRKELDWGDPICAACLSSKSDASNDIFECDSCRITVHEGCYIFDDNLSISSGTESSSSTEPWFCDVCRNDRKDVSCELCPNSGGLFKETSDGRWVHLVCSLYVSGIATSQNGKPNIADLPYTKWGSHACQICENDRNTHVGICISCDAGFCRFFTHATCAQMAGLLSIPNPLGGEQQAADPFFASCKAHTNADVSKQRALNYKRLQEQVRIKRDQKLEENLTVTERLSQLEIQNKLTKIRQKVEMKNREKLCQPPVSPLLTTTFIKKSKQSLDPRPGTSKSFMKANHFLIPKPNTMAPPGFNEKKKTRLLYTSAFALTFFQNKAERMGLNLNTLEREEKHERLVASVSRKWNVHPALNVEFAAYYADREIRIESMSEQCERLDKENYRLNDEQIALNSALEIEALNHMEAMEETIKLDSDINRLKNILKKLVPGNKKLNSIRGASPSKLKPASRRASPSQPSSSKSPKGGSISSPRSRAKREAKVKKSYARSPPPGGRLAQFQCALCNRNDLQHMITRCDHCKKHFHLHCLDPPLTRMPKKSRLCGWMCSDCGDIEIITPEQRVDTEAPRELRGRTKIKRPAKYTEYDESDIDEEYNRKEQKFLGPLSPLHPLTIPDLPSPTALMQMHVKIKTEPVQNIQNGNARTRNRANSSSSCASYSADADMNASTFPNDDAGALVVKSKPQAKAKRKYTKKIKPPVVKLEKSVSISNKKESPPRKKRKSSLSSPEPPTPNRRARNGSGFSPTAIPVIDLVETASHSPGTSGLTPAEKSIVDSRSKLFAQTKLNSPTAAAILTSKDSSPAGSSPLNSISPDQNRQVSAKKQRKQKIVAKDTSTPSLRVDFWSNPEDLIIVSGPPSGNSLNYSTVVCGTSSVGGKCDTCGKSDPTKNLVTCDKCKLEFHFFCLQPPLKYSPKRRGYSWFCANCDETSSMEEIKVPGTLKSPH